MKLQHLAVIEQEHSVFSAYARASFSGNTDAMVSSVVFGDHFIHSYNFGIWDAHSLGFLTLRTYSQHEKACYQHVHVGDLDVVQETQHYLRVSLCTMVHVSSNNTHFGT